MFLVRQVLNDLATDWTRLSGVLIAAVVILVLDIAGTSSQGFEPSYTLRDVQDVGGVELFAGMISTIGGVMFAVAAAVAIFSAALLRERNRRPEAGAIGSLGLLSALLALDDLFQIHERVVPWLLGPGFQSVVYLGYFALLVLFVLRYGRELRRQPLGLAVMAILFLGLSVLADVAQDVAGFGLGPPWLLEESFKFIGVMYWAAYVASVSYRVVLGRRLPLTESQPGAHPSRQGPAETAAAVETAETNVAEPRHARSRQGPEPAAAVGVAEPRHARGRVAAG